MQDRPGPNTFMYWLSRDDGVLLQVSRHTNLAWPETRQVARRKSHTLSQPSLDGMVCTLILCLLVARPG